MPSKYEVGSMVAKIVENQRKRYEARLLAAFKRLDERTEVKSEDEVKHGA